MEVGLHTPLLDFFRRDEVAHDDRVLAAQGTISPRPLEQLGLLMLLSADRDPEIRDIAEATLRAIPLEQLSALIAHADVPPEIRDFFVARGVAVAATPAADIDRPLIDHDETDYGSEETTGAEKASLFQRLSAMSVPERVKAAMKGTREMRALLVRDSNKLVALAVLSSPKLTETEVEGFARMGSVSDDVLRSIARTRVWVKNYGVALALVKNAKTPVAVSLSLLSRLNEGDVKKLAMDRNIPEPLRIAARKRIVMG